jgi:hypothetical protein
VKYFRDKGLKVVDVALGNTHAIAVACILRYNYD